MVFTDKIPPFSYFGGEKLLTTCVFNHMNLNGFSDAHILQYQCQTSLSLNEPIL